jgi:STE24 endopeptidase
MQTVETSQLVTLVFAALVLTSFGLKLWLSRRQMRHVAANADSVPARFADRIGLPAHRKAAAYTIAKQRFGVVESAVGVAILVLLTLGGGLQQIADILLVWLDAGFVFQIAVIAAVALLLGVIELPFAWYRQFRIEQDFGFNRMTIGLFVSDALKSLALSVAIGLPVVVVVLWLMETAGVLWWLYAWLVWITFNALILVLYPTFIAPWFNKFQPLADATLAQRIETLLTRTGFASRGVFVMDGSRRSAHGNAYFTGLGKAKRIVFFDTLIERLAPSEIEAVLAHELGHFKLKHITKRLAMMFAGSLLFFFALGWLATQVWFYQGLGVAPLLDEHNHGLALVLFILVLPVVTFPLAPLVSRLSRKHEFEADAFAAQHTRAEDLSSALVKLYEDNASTLTPDPLYSAFYDSHPPAAMRIERLQPEHTPQAQAT